MGWSGVGRTQEVASLQETISALVRADRMCDYFGVADLTEAREFVEEQGQGLLGGLPLAVSIGIALPGPVVDMLERRELRAARVSYRTHAYEAVNRRLDLVASEVASVIQSSGHRAVPVASSERVSDERIRGLFSHKLAAGLSGLGWIGKSCLLVTPRHGPRVRWASVLTDAPLSPTGTRMAERCGDCDECVKRCPVQAFTGRAFDPAEPREARYRADKCDAYFKAMGKEGEVAVCGLCLYVCPQGGGKAT